MSQPKQLVMRRARLDDLPPLPPPLPPGYTLRTATLADADALAALLRVAFEDAVWTPEHVRAELLESDDVDSTFVIVAPDGGLAATASVQRHADDPPSTGTVHWVGGDPAHAGQGLGYSVCLAVLHRFVALGMTDARLSTDDFRVPAIRTYFRLGFVPEHRHPTHPERWAKIETLGLRPTPPE